MNTYQVHLVARRCMLVREHARAMFLPLENVGTAVRLNHPGYLDGSLAVLAIVIDCHRPETG